MGKWRKKPNVKNTFLRWQNIAYNSDEREKFRCEMNDGALKFMCGTNEQWTAYVCMCVCVSLYERF